MLSHKEGSKLHDKIAGAYSHSIDMMEDTGEYNAALLNGARQFLKDNNVLMDSGVGTPLDELNAKLIQLPFEEEEQQHRDTAQATGL
jgi:hypothetical protein